MEDIGKFTVDHTGVKLPVVRDSFDITRVEIMARAKKCRPVLRVRDSMLWPSISAVVGGHALHRREWMQLSRAIQRREKWRGDFYIYPTKQQILGITGSDERSTFNRRIVVLHDALRVAWKYLSAGADIGEVARTLLNSADPNALTRQAETLSASASHSTEAA